jgi:anti-sigma B factor antagonist
MRLTESRHGSCDAVRIVGDIDFHYSPVFRSVLRGKLRAECPALIVDLSEVDYLDSSGMAALLEYARDCRQFGGHFALVGLNERLQKVFEIVQLHKHLPIHRDCAEASAAFVSHSPAPMDTHPTPHTGAAA